MSRAVGKPMLPTQLYTSRSLVALFQSISVNQRSSKYCESLQVDFYAGTRTTRMG